MPALENVKHELFANEYIVDFNATRAAERCGYNADYGRQLLHNITVKARIAELRDELTDATEITAERIARAYAEIAFMDGRDIARTLDALSTNDGRRLAERLEDLPRAVTAPIRKLSKRVDNKGTTFTVEAYDRHRALEVLRERYWVNDEAADEFITAIEGMRAEGVPDLSEQSNLQPTHNTDDDPSANLAPAGDATGGDDDIPTKWRRS